MVYGKMSVCTLCRLCRSSQINIPRPLPAPRPGSITQIRCCYCGCRFSRRQFLRGVEALLLVAPQWFARIWTEGRSSTKSRIAEFGLSPVAGEPVTDGRLLEWRSTEL